MKLIELKGEEGRRYLNELARLRLEVFREFPYLYEGDLDYERKYLSRYFNCEDSLIVLALNDNEKAVGMSSCLPLMSEEEDFRGPFVAKGIRAEEVFYFGESILQKNYRGKGVGKEFFERRENHAKQVLKNDLLFTAFCAVKRTNYPVPVDYHSPDFLWRKRGYQKQKDLVASYQWRDIGEKEQSTKELNFWLKAWK